MLLRQERFLKDYPATLNVKASCRRLRVHYTVVYDWIRNNAEFAARFRLVELHALQDVRGALCERAKEWMHPPKACEPADPSEANPASRFLYHDG